MAESARRFHASLLLIASIVLASEALACFPVRAYTVVDYPSGFLVPRESFTPRAPRVSLLRVGRGDDSHPCSRFGTLVFALDEGIHPNIAGYRLRVLSGLPDDVFPDAIVRPASFAGRDDDRLTFMWTKTWTRSKPLDARVEVRAVARDGVEGKPLILKVQHAGGKNGIL